MPWSETGKGRFKRALGENETFIKILGDAARPLNREHWAMNVVVAVTTRGQLAEENLAPVFREAWKVLRFQHPTIAAYVVDETTYVYDVPSSAALEKWTMDTFHVVEDKTVDELIANTRPGPYTMMTYLPKSNELLSHSQHWRSDGVGGLILMDDFLALAAQSPPPDTSTLQWGQETVRLALPIEEAANVPTDPSDMDKRLGQQGVASFGATLGAIGISCRAPANTVPCGTRIARLHLTKDETTAAVKACKIRDISVTSAVHASVAAANYAFAAPEDKSKHYTSTIRYSFRPFLPKPYSGRECASAIYTTGWMLAVPATSSWDERARKYHEEYHQGLSSEYVSAHREYASGLCQLLRNMPPDVPSPTDVDISSLGVAERLLGREKGTAERGLTVESLSGGLEMVNRQCICHVWTFRDQLGLNLVYNEAFYDETEMEAFLKAVKDSLLKELGV